jgi:magnesium-transporting ATPase (P-type)
MDTLANSKPPVNVAWHALAADEVLRRLGTQAQSGLSASEVDRRLEKYGRNMLPEGSKQGPFMRFLMQLNNVLVYVLLAAGFVKIMTGLWLDAAIILGVVFINAVLGFIQEGKAEQALNAIRKMLPAEARTLRDGEVRVLPAEELVPGDIVRLESGDRVPADLRLVDVKSLRTEEAALTGESVPIDKTTNAVAENATIGDREGMAFSGTLVASGRGTGAVVATGGDTEMGRINQMMTAVSALDTPLLRQIEKFGYRITAAIAVLSAVVFVFGRWVREMPFVDIFQAVVSSHSRGTACVNYRDAGDRRAAHGPTQCHHPSPSGRRNPGVGFPNLLRQDRHPHAHGNDGRLGRYGRIGLSRNGRWLRGERRDSYRWQTCGR